VALSGTSDLKPLNRLKDPPGEHLIGRPDTNQVIPKLNQLGVLPVSLIERQLLLAAKPGPYLITPRDRHGTGKRDGNHSQNCNDMEN
jgi:hypothetical protein